MSNPINGNSSYTAAEREIAKAATDLLECTGEGKSTVSKVSDAFNSLCVKLKEIIDSTPKPKQTFKQPTVFQKLGGGRNGNIRYRAW